ncbi:MAG: Fe-S cluster biogenesis protein NfuA [Sphingobacteriales bacterium]|jgi:Fe-S cluster biogenesis protein NfuA
MENQNKDLAPRIEAALDTIRPYLIADGGNVEIAEITDDLIVKLKLVGSCGSCPMSMMTLKAGVEQALIRAVPEIKAVEAINITDFDDPNAVIPDAVKERMG